MADDTPAVTSMSAQDIRNFILEADDLPEETVTVPEWGGIQFLMVGLNAYDRSQLLAASTNKLSGKVDSAKMYPLILIECARHPVTREAIFNRSDVDALNKKSGKALERVAQVGVRINGLSEESLIDAKSDSSPTASTDSSSN